MNRFPVFCLLAASMVGLHAETFIDHARVRRVSPQYENVSAARNECSRRLVSDAGPSRDGQPYGLVQQYGGAALGGVAGALVGNRIGRGHGREAATALGAVVGAFAGDQYSHGNRVAQYADVSREVTTCRTVNDVHARLTGYRVDYEYRGQHYSTFSHTNPGSSMPMRVSFEPLNR